MARFDHHTDVETTRDVLTTFRDWCLFISYGKKNAHLGNFTLTWTCGGISNEIHHHHPHP